MTPYTTGQIYKKNGRRVMILGHVWWNVEQTYAYYLMAVNDDGECVGEPKYDWCHNSLQAA